MKFFGIAVIAAVATIFSTSAFSQATVKTVAERDRANLNAVNDYPVIKFESTKTRAEVTAELHRTSEGKADSGQAVNTPVKQKSVYDSSLYNGA